ncbi:hypothetical protein NIES592_08040 [Fischerella major NIES-592]|uniref:Uncharacterized protein n=1 Tax=Fischerella major NIES-592 TaxID=210994 RepID=A0A1U7H1E5_9CYAN|nr:hypothetical protein [Fischerella major]OKH14817.1 hypothetical protein NIES592_08040 [Fischerella major NIES-592]
MASTKTNQFTILIRELWQQGAYVESFPTTDDVYHVWEVNGEKYTYSASAASETRAGNDQKAYPFESIFGDKGNASH